VAETLHGLVMMEVTQVADQDAIVPGHLRHHTSYTAAMLSSPNGILELAF
jgi:hypothetical protein